ncbi:MAG: right-handed parallel beta-helix repeat-containing protein [Ktedonobacteraceae bacterium]
MSRSFRMRRAMLFLGPIAALLLLLTGIFAYKMPTQAHASGVVTLYVGSFVGNNSSCSSPGFTSVQTAVDVANPGDIVYLCGTTPYTEQVIITKQITLTGDPGATLAAPNPFPAPNYSLLPPQFTTDNLFVPQTVVFIWGASANVKIKNITISGVMPGNGSCADDEFGVLAIDGGTVSLNGDQVLNIQDSNPGLYGCQFGVAVQIGREYWPTSDFSSYVTEKFVGHATISKTTVAGYQKNGITIDGPGTTATLTQNTVNGAGRNNGNPFSPIIAQNGIQIGRGASASATYNTVTDNSYTGTAPASDGGILVFGGPCGDSSATPLTTNTLIGYNTVQDNDIGVYISNLIIDQNGYCALPQTPTKIKAYSNHITNSAASNIGGYNLFNDPGGYQAGISDEGYADHLTNNQICGVGYTPVPNPPPYLSNIDVVANSPVLKGNTICQSDQTIGVSTMTKIPMGLNLHAVTSAYK